MLAELAPGQIHEGTVRSLRDFGAFVDIGGVDGLLHVSQISWDRLKHPSEALKEGQKIRVKIDKINPETHKISLSHRDLLENPWKTAATKYSATSRVKGTVSKLTEFGAFVRLEAGRRRIDPHQRTGPHARIPRKRHRLRGPGSRSKSACRSTPTPSESAFLSRPCRPARSRRKKPNRNRRKSPTPAADFEAIDTAQRRPRPQHRRSVWVEMVTLPQFCDLTSGLSDSFSANWARASQRKHLSTLANTGFPAICGVLAEKRR